VRTRALLHSEHITTPPGAWLPNRAALSARGRRFVRAVRHRLIDVAAVRCDGYTANLHAGGHGALSLSRLRAALICGALARHGLHIRLTVIGQGTHHPIATNRTPAGRAHNRRVQITITHRPTHP
jgi:outer membrane protein OmpA-like peptidoglycan-associated protein